MGSGYYGGIHYGEYSLGGVAPAAIDYPDAVEAHNVSVRTSDASGVVFRSPDGTGATVRTSETDGFGWTPSD